MKQIPETGLRRSSYLPLDYLSPVDAVGMKQIPETGLRPDMVRVNKPLTDPQRRNEADTGNGIET
jgi:hypothetical protein